MWDVPCTHSMFGRSQAGHLHLGRKHVHGRCREGMVFLGVLFWCVLAFIDKVLASACTT